MVEYMGSNITLMKWMIAEGYAVARTLTRRIKSMEKWFANGELLKADANAQYAAVIEIDLAEVTEPILACPNRVCLQRDDVNILSEVASAKIDEAEYWQMSGSCMTSIGHFHAAGKVLEGKSDAVTNRATRQWIAPPTKIDALILTEEGSRRPRQVRHAH
ncbi:MAG: aconitase [Proteobacteria bacterium]|nr:aconitase [Pseudomonadota bacterium]